MTLASIARDDDPPNYDLGELLDELKRDLFEAQRSRLV